MAKAIRGGAARPSGVAAMLLMSACCLGWASQRTEVAATQGPAAVQAQGAQEAVAAKDLDRTAKQKQLADQAERLVTMANQLKLDVDKTNKNILSLDVVRKAEEIELLARQMKGQGKK